MASLLPSYQYDIFISYRQKDNKHDGWVTEFVNNLKGELESTFKEEISVYFDINPHDGLLETHDVNASLKEKLKCLAFIPIISQTYCDPKSFAWQHEFCAFNKLAREEQFGRDIRLAGGNVASRILPIKINDLDPEDKTLLENELGGILRSIDFIYKASGVNRPLKPNDERSENLNHTYYRDQINKVANAIKEIITALKKHSQSEGTITKEVVETKIEKPKNLKTKIIIASVVVLALVILGYFIIPNLSNTSKPVEKSIAVLPFINDSPDPANPYFINGIMDEIINNLQKISDFSRVLPRTSVEQFRGETKPSIPEIAKKLNVNYIVQGSGKKYGNKFVLGVQLIAAHNEKQLWGKSYEQEIYETSDMINIESQIAQSIAEELKATMTPEEKQLIEKTPTGNLTAYDFYQRGRDEHTKYWIDNSNRAALQKAENLYYKALKYDSTYAQAYTGMARVYWDKNYGKEKEYFSENFMDSVLILTNKAISLDNQLSEAYTLRGDYYANKGNINKAIDEYDKSLKLNPNSWEAYYGKGDMYGSDDLVNSIDNLQKAASLNHGFQLSVIFRYITYEYSSAGFIDKAKYYNLEALRLDGDSVSYIDNLGFFESRQGNYEKAIEFLRRGYAIDSTNLDIVIDLGQSYMFLNQFKESLKYVKKRVEMFKVLGTFSSNGTHRIGWAYWENGYKKEGDDYFNKQIEYSKNDIELKRPWGQKLYPYYDMAGIYAFRGDNEKAYKYLKLFNQRQRMPLWAVTYMKNDPLFNSIRNEPEFQQILRDVESKYQAEHERVRKWLEEQGTMK